MGKLLVKKDEGGVVQGKAPYVRLDEGWRAGKVLFEKTGDTTWTERWRDKDNKVEINITNSPKNIYQKDTALGWQDFNTNQFGIFGSCPDPTLANFPNIAGFVKYQHLNHPAVGFLYMHPTTNRSSIVVRWTGPKGSPGSATFIRDGSDGDRERFKLSGNSVAFSKFMINNNNRRIQLTLS